jgi:hypothetical protein
VLFFVAPVVALVVTKRVCRELVEVERVEAERRQSEEAGISAS